MTATPLIERSAEPPLALGFAALVFVPTLIFYFGFSSSLAIGTLIACLMVFGLLFLAVEEGGRLPGDTAARVLVPCANLTILVLLAIALHAAGAILLGGFDIRRAGLSALFLPVMLLGAWSLAVLVSFASAPGLVRAARTVAVLLLAMSLAAAIGIWPSVPAPRVFDKAIFPFTEPSHLVLALMPLYMIATAGSRGLVRLALLAAGAAVVLAVQNLTLAAGWLLVLAVSTPLFLLPFALAALALGLSFLDLSYFIDRLTFSGTDNLSALVFLQGWELMAESLARSGGWGLGFQQLGVQETQTASSFLIFALLKADTNVFDGGFTSAKLVSEFGVFGIALVVLLLVLGFRSFLRLRGIARSSLAVPANEVFVHAVQLAFLIELMIRGAGYYTGSTVFLVAAMILRFSDVGRRAERPSSGEVAAA